jgi:hypothetical protein
MPVICNMNVNNASLSTPSPPISQPWIKDLIGSIGEISGQDSMDTSCKNAYLGAGYHQCKNARRGKVSKTHFDVSVERGGGCGKHCTRAPQQFRHTARKWFPFLFHRHTKH